LDCWYDFSILTDKNTKDIKIQRIPYGTLFLGFSKSLNHHSMKKMLLSFLFYFLLISPLHPQVPLTPDKIYGELFIAVQMGHIFPDNKTFTDCIPKRDPKEIIADYKKLTTNSTTHYSFILPADPGSKSPIDKNADVVTHIRQLWKVLSRTPDETINGSSLLSLPNPYIVPGGRFREVYYWDSYFTMLGLRESGETGMIENMVNNFAYLISRYGHIPNGNRTYYLSRSQPPFFSLMVELLAKKEGDSIYAQYLGTLQSEYDYWMDKTGVTRHVVRLPGGDKLNRYYDQETRPRQESFAEDSALGKENKGKNAYSNKKNAVLYRNLRSGAETGWDFSSRWFADGKNISTIRVTDLIPVDLNSLLFHLELTLAKAYRASGNLLMERVYQQLADKRKNAINKYLYNSADGWYYDYSISKKARDHEKTIAGFTPFFFEIAPKEYSQRAATTIKRQFLKPGGILTTLRNSGQQWDAPNGWAPLQWMTIKGLENYGYNSLAKETATRWIHLNIKVYQATGKLMEKYNVADTTLKAGGGEYPTQDGFGWTNGVLISLIDQYQPKNPAF
jgi:alpha,alpha-trehalase